MASYAESLRKTIEAGGQIGIAAGIVVWIARVSSAPVLVMLRRNFGEREFSFLYVVLQSVVILVVGGGLASPSPDGVAIGGYSGSENFGIYSHQVAYLVAGLVFFLGVYHQLGIMGRNRRGERWHSKYDGDSLPIFNILPFSSSGFVVRMVYEPMFVFLLAVVISIANPLLGMWLAVSSIFLVFLSRIAFSGARDAYLDAVDAQIESEHMEASLNGSPPTETQGYVVRGVSDASSKDRGRMVKRLQGGSSAVPIMQEG